MDGVAAGQCALQILFVCGAATDNLDGIAKDLSGPLRAADEDANVVALFDEAVCDRLTEHAACAEE